MRIARACLILTLVGLAPLAVADPRPGNNVTVVHEPPGDVPSIGPRHAPVTIEFFCNFGGERQSVTIYRNLIELAERHPRRLRIELHIVGNYFSEAAYEAFDQGGFRAFADAALGEGMRRRMQESDIAKWAKAAGIDVREVEAARKDGRHKPRIERAEALRTRRGMPNGRLAINGAPPTGTATNLDEFESLYDQHYAIARALLDDGVPLEDVFDRLVEQRERNMSRAVGLPGRIDDSPTLEAPPVEPPGLSLRVVDTAAFPPRGAYDARVVMTLFCGMQSKICRDMFRVLNDVHAVFPDEVRMSFAPLFDDDVHPDARLAHEAAVCAADQGMYWEYVDTVFRVFRPRALSVEHLEAHAEAIDLDAAAFHDCVTSRIHSKEVDAAAQEARDAGLVYTPSLVIGRRIYIGYHKRDDVTAIINYALRPGLLERARYLRRQILEVLSPLTVGDADPPEAPM